jgi:F-type H+-transporting ATPase subunit beta
MEEKMENKGQVIQVVGAVVDAKFNGGELPAIYDALHVKINDKTVTLEVAQHLDEHSVRAVSLSSTDGLKRGDEVIATGAPISVVVGDVTQGRMFNVTGEAIDGMGQVEGTMAPIHRQPPSLTEQSNTD